jgi:histone H3/H4
MPRTPKNTPVQFGRPAKDIFKATLDVKSKSHAGKAALAGLPIEDASDDSETVDDAVSVATETMEDNAVEQTAKPRRRRLHAGTKALREIRQQQTSVLPIMPRASVYNVVRAVAAEIGLDGYRFTKGAIDVLRAVSEDEMLFHLSEGMNMAARADCKSLMFTHFDSVRRTVKAARMRYGGVSDSSTI